MNYWAMKVSAALWDIFKRERIIGIYENDIKENYTSLSNEYLAKLLSSGQGYNEMKDKIFRDFCNNMKEKDFVIIGIGGGGQFNIVGTVMVSGKYSFDGTRKPIHYRRVEIITSLDRPFPSKKMMRTGPLELVGKYFSEIEFYSTWIMTFGNKAPRS